MPTVSATDIPYRGFPEGRTSPQAPDAYQQIPTSPAMFGSLEGEALQRAGQEGEKLATEVAKLGAYQKRYLDLAENDKLTLALDDELHRQKYGDVTAGLDANGQPLVPGFKNRFGSDAIDHIKSGEPAKQFRAAVDRIAAGAPNEMVRQMFLRGAMTKRSAFDTSLDEHFTSQLVVHNDQIQKGRSAQADRDASFAWNDDNALADAMNKGREAVAAALGSETNPDIVNAAFAQSDAARVGMAIDAALANNNPERAKELLDKYSAGPNPTFTGKLADHYNSRIKPQLDHKAATRATATVNQSARGAAASYAEDSAIIAEVDKSIKAAVDASPDKDPAILKDLESQVRTRLGGSAIDAAIAAENPNRALRLLQTYSDSMNGEQLKKYHDQIKPLIDKQAAATAAGRVRGAPLVPHNPSPEILSGTGWSADQYQTFRSHVAERESESYAQPPNAGGYMGRFQMGRKEIRETAERLGVPAPTEQQFLKDPALQERFFENYTLDHHNSLMTLSDQYRNASPAERAGVLMGAHLGGVNGALRYLTSGGKDDPADSNGTHISSYVRSMRQRMAVGGALPPAPASAPATAPPAPVAPGSPAAPAAAAPSTGAVEVWGDSLGVGLKGQLKSEGTVVGGASPSAILASIKAKPPDYWNGKQIVLASGSNRTEMDKVEETIAYLKSNKADVVVVGYGPKFPEKNVKLREIAQTHNVHVIDAEDVAAGEGVHPSGRGYASMAGRIRALRSAPIVVPGMKVPGNIPAPVPLVPPGALAPQPPGAG